MSRGTTVIDEQWLAPLGGMMIGGSRTVRGDSAVEFEFLVLRPAEPGLSYEAHPSGQATTTFRTTQPPSSSELVFENPEHDFPQRVGYRRVGSDSLLAWIEGSREGRTRRIEFPYRRSSCTASGV